MADERFKFRCYRCNQLLSASRSRIGTVVDCPRCRAKLQVPEPEAVPARSAAGRAANQAASRGGAVAARSDTLPTELEDIAASIPEELATLRPEDIRVEAEFADLVITTSPEPPSPPVISPPVEPPRPQTSASPGAAVPLVEVRAASIPRDEPGLGGVLPPIEIEPATIRPPERPLQPAREVVLQPTTVLAWSLLVLMAIPLAFTAGLLIGHFIWR